VTFSIWPRFSQASPFSIEYAPSLLREMRVNTEGGDAFGLLYGTREGQNIRVISTRGRARLKPLGIFAARVRGKVFLTEEDLERFEKADACVALVISGTRAGFFVRDAAGSMETVRSYEEFSTGEQPPAAVKPKWPWAAALLLPLIPLAFHRPAPKEIALAMRENDGQLRISWSAPTRATITILDGGETRLIPIGPQQLSATYARRSDDVTVKIGVAQTRFVGPPTPLEKTRASVQALESKLAMLRADRVSREVKIAALERRLQ
jgi:hypothetical protein